MVPFLVGAVVAFVLICRAEQALEQGCAESYAFALCFLAGLQLQLMVRLNMFLLA